MGGDRKQNTPESEAIRGVLSFLFGPPFPDHHAEGGIIHLGQHQNRAFDNILFIKGFFVLSFFACHPDIKE